MKSDPKVFIPIFLISPIPFVTFTPPISPLYFIIFTLINMYIIAKIYKLIRQNMEIKKEHLCESALFIFIFNSQLDLMGNWETKNRNPLFSKVSARFPTTVAHLHLGNPGNRLTGFLWFLIHPHKSLLHSVKGDFGLARGIGIILLPSPDLV